MSGNPFEQAEQVKPRQSGQRPTPPLVIGAAMLGALLIRDASETWQTVHDLQSLLTVLYFLILCAWAKRS